MAGTKETTDSYTVANYARFPVALVRGEGCRVWDEDGRSYLDMMAGIAVSALGHAHPGLVRAISEQAATLLHTSNLFYNEPSARLAEQLVNRSFASRVFFCNSGTEANEAAIKMARRSDATRHGIVSSHDSFHGRTMASLAATGQGALREGFGPMPEGFTHVAYNDTAALAEAADENTAAVLVEPLLGEGGVVVPDDDYLARVREICDQAGCLMILDEVQTGMGRTGTLFAYEPSGAVPDILTTAKGLAGGIPIGAVLATEKASAALVAGSHGTTFGGNPVACRASLALLEAFDNDAVIDNCKRSGAHLLAALKKLAGTRSDVVDVRGKGLLVGMELDRPARPVVEAALAEGLLVNSTADTVLRFLPPLIISTDEIDEGIDMLGRALG
ncbi:MAG: acetylornithine transaminase [Deltaproteobacteria bacterium]